ncbi:protein YgfX [Nevskia sp.]|uniref:protein YgfX n=1 Tax=Nevskia sp. TaxID=1929292 RepID=UPI0025F81C16|nr:protein YgfX [Nevskia sp.]
MSSNAFSATLDLRPRPSLRGMQLIVGLHVLAASLAMIAQPPDHMGLLLSGLLLISWFSLRRHPVIGFGKKALIRLTWHADSPKWSLETAAGEASDATLLPSTLVTRHLLVLNFKLADGRRRSRALVGDELDPELLRRLRARLKSGEALAKPGA